MRSARTVKCFFVDVAVVFVVTVVLAVTHRLPWTQCLRLARRSSVRGMEPFTIAVPDAVLDDLHERLGRTRLPNQLPDIGWEQGTERNYLSNCTHIGIRATTGGRSSPDSIRILSI